MTEAMVEYAVRAIDELQGQQEAAAIAVTREFRVRWADAEELVRRAQDSREIRARRLL